MERERSRRDEARAHNGAMRRLARWWRRNGVRGFDGCAAINGVRALDDNLKQISPRDLMARLETSRQWRDNKRIERPRRRDNELSVRPRQRDNQLSTRPRRRDNKLEHSTAKAR